MKANVKKLSFLVVLGFIFQLLSPFSILAINTDASQLDATFVTAEYYIRNRHYPRYVQVDDNDKPGYSTSGSILEQWDFCGEAHQRWTITMVESGYYKIVNVKSGMAISVPANKLGSENVALVQEPYTGADRQKWSITYTEHGSYKIKAKSSEAYATDLAMVIGDSLFGNSNGLNVEQRKYVDNESYRDEWELISMKRFTLNSRYDNGYANYFPGTTEITYISAAEAKVISALESVLPVKITPSATISQITSSADSHTGNCTTSSCGSNCRNHHKNIGVLSDAIYNAPRNTNTIYISWMQRRGELCVNSGSAHSLLPIGTLAAVRSNADGKMRPVIGMFDVDYLPSYTVCSQITLLHEIAHVFQLPEQYTGASHDDNKDYKCVMMRYSANKAQTLYNEIFVKNESPYCESCLDALWNNIMVLSFPAN